MITTENYVVFQLTDEFFAIPVSVAYEVIGYQEPTEVPEMQVFIRGVINVRGNIVPLIDLRQKFDMQEKKADVETVIIMISLDIEGAKYNVGIVVDKVVSVLEINETKILSVPQLGSKYNPFFVNGIFKNESDYIIMLDIIKIFKEQEIIQIINN